MAGDTHSVDIGDDDLLPPWSTVFDVLEATDANDWVGTAAPLDLRS
jgi:hypothetical protein